jgi:4'-phosphopantetheinyl transferase
MDFSRALSPPPSPLTLEADTLDVWIADLKRAPRDFRGLRGTLSPDEVERAAKFHFSRDRDRFIAARGILRDILARYLGRSPGVLRFCYGPFGKPALAEDFDSNLLFNLSHSDNMALYAIACNSKIGVDLERIDASFVKDGIDQKFFSPIEVAELRSLPASARLRAFFNCWTRKEAYVKAVGGGLQISLQSFDVSLAPDEDAAFLSERESGWSLRALPVGNDYAAAVAVEGKIGELRWREWKMN